MLNSRTLISVCVLLLAGALLVGCGPKKPAGPPQELLDELASLDQAYAALAPMAPTAEDSAKYQAAITEAKNALGQSNYSQAAEKAKLARLELARLEGSLYFRQLEQYNPDPPLTYHYRQQVKNSEDAQAAGKIDEAIAAAEEAKKQARLALNLQKQCMESVENELAQLKAEIETFYRPDLDIILLYWKAAGTLPNRKCEETRKAVADLRALVNRFKATTITYSKTFVVTAPPEFVRIYGDPIMFQEVTPEGLKTRLARVQVGTKVNFIRSSLAAPDKTYYYVEDPNTGTKGWMAEERLWPERAAQLKSRP